MIDFVKEIRFDRLGAFTYSREEGTKAASLPKQIPQFIKSIRRNKVMALQQKIAWERIKIKNLLIKKKLKKKFKKK